jgi:tRNA threonylcarbamoyladenosine biosynthesis protein TsaB
MLTLGIDTSAKVASCGVCDGERVLVSGSIHTGLTHSQTLLPLVEALLKSANISFSDIDCFAVSSGPGSFTGLRIGVSAIKGLAVSLGKPCKGVSSLKALAYNLLGQDAVACCVMDARCNQFYNALFRVRDGSVQRLCDDRAIGAQELMQNLLAMNEKIILVGDGAELFYGMLEQQELSSIVAISPVPIRYQSGVSVCYASMDEKEISPEALMPGYLRLAQAQRERINKENKNKEG